MSRNIHYSAIEPIHQGSIEFMALVRPPAPIQPHFLPGAIEVSWIREASYRVVLEHFGVHVDCTGTYCDVGQLLSTLDEAVATAKAVARRYKISADTTLSARVLVDVVDSPYVPAPDDNPSLRVRRWMSLDDGLYLRTPDMGTAWLAGDLEFKVDHPLATIGPINAISDFEVWSSQSDQQQQAQQVDELRRLSAEPFVVPH